MRVETPLADSGRDVLTHLLVHRLLEFGIAAAVAIVAIAVMVVLWRRS